MNDSEIGCLKNELEYEKKCRESASHQNSQLQKQIGKLEEELERTDYVWEGDEELKNQHERHKSLLDKIDTLKDELPVLKQRLRNAKICGPDCKLKHDDLNINLDLLTAAELVRTVKKFERLKTDLISTLRSKEWRLDSESKLFVRVNDQKKYLQNELMYCQNNIARLQRNAPYLNWHNAGRGGDDRTLESKRAPFRKYQPNDKLPPLVHEKC